MKTAIIPAREEHIEHIAANIRECDMQEMFDYNLKTPTEALQLSLANSKIAWTGFVDGVPVCMFGVAKPHYIWLVGTGDVDKYNKIFLVKSKKLLRRLLNQHPYLDNYVSVENTRSVEWLKFLNFNMDEPKPMGPFKKIFIHFWIGEKHD